MALNPVRWCHVLGKRDKPFAPGSDVSTARCESSAAPGVVPKVRQATPLAPAARLLANCSSPTRHKPLVGFRVRHQDWEQLQVQRLIEIVGAIDCAREQMVRRIFQIHDVAVGDVESICSFPISLLLHVRRVIRRRRWWGNWRRRRWSNWIPWIHTASDILRCRIRQ